jgi:NAD dependent epimerase/dehydratase family enzyme
VNLAGVGVGDRRWTASYKALIRSSRIPGTRALAGVLAKLSPLPATLVSASAVGWYGDTGEQQEDESGSPGKSFMAAVCC